MSQSHRPVAVDQQVLVRWREVHVVRLQLHTVLCVPDWEPALTPDDLRHQAAVARVDVLDDDDDRSEVGGQAAENLGQSYDAAGRGGDRNYVEGRGRPALLKPVSQRHRAARFRPVRLRATSGPDHPTHLRHSSSSSCARSLPAVPPQAKC